MVFAKLALLKVILVAITLLDATTSSGHKEINPLMQPFSHGGAATMVAGQALYTTLGLRLTKAPQRNNAMAMDVAAHAVGIAFTLTH